MDGFPPLPPPPGGEAEPAEEPTDRVRRSPGWMPIGIALAVLLVLGGTAALVLGGSRTGDRCEDGMLGSARFGYCIAAPGWRSTNEQRTTRLPYDELVKPDDATTVRIVAIDLDAGQDLDLVVRTVRSIETEDGAEVGAVVERRVAGVPAAQWDISLDGSGTDDRQIREVVFVRDDTAWRVQLLADARGFDVRAAEFEAILRSWTFR